MVRALRAKFPIAECPEVAAAVREWHDLVHGEQSDFETTWASFIYGWDRVKFPTGAAFDAAATRARDNPEPPEAIRYENPSTRALVALCYQLAHNQGGEPFYLSCRKAAEFLGIEHDAANRLLGLLIHDCILKVVEGHTTRKARRFVYVSESKDDW